MQSLIMAIVGVLMMVLGYFLYSKFLSKRVYKLDPAYETPAHKYRDGIDYVPANKWVLWGHHFTSVAGAAPIVGPAVAVIWGWLPAFLWVTLGTVFFAGMHDMGALWASARHKGRSIGTLSGRYIGGSGRILFLVVIFFLLLMVNAVFAVVIADLLISTPTAVIPTWGAIAVALLIGQAIYRMKWNLALVSVVGVAVLYGLIILGDIFPIVLPETILGMSSAAFWIIVLFLYAGVASLLPVWMLLQPRDYINGLQLFVGLGLLYLAIFISNPTVVAPAINHNVPEGTPGIMPLLFVTVACGAISGFHGVVASGTSSKQLNNENDARLVGYFGAVGEGLLALGTIVATTSGFATLAAWEEVYSAFNEGGAAAFVQAGGGILNAGLAIPESLSATILATMAVLFAATTMDTGVRLQRFVTAEIFELFNIKLNVFMSTLVVLLTGFALAFSAGGDGRGGMIIWPLFGTTNQLLAALTMSILVVILLRTKRPVWPVLIPLIFVFFVSMYAAIIQLGTFIAEGNWLLVVIDAIILMAAVWVVLAAVSSMVRTRNQPLDLDEQMEDISAGSSV
ncbi:MAG TPA: carbon starvation protein A [Enteractinococcus helveticum]|uniref:Carbon starvation protein A n=1 Tax=Enteractinococcus helveticum TaxID=1837282 RepID=A0A921FMV5_9MICC|nr:carbon starvation protein A [Enteractinococcus helveticum]HJF14202.1 carbon starvation protein A [Enteractinococcus helveticum]